MSGAGVVWCVYHHYHDRVLLLPLLPAEEDHCCDPLCLTFTEQHLWPQAIALATMNTSLLNTYSHVARLGCVKLPVMHCGALRYLLLVPQWCCFSTLT